MRRLSRIILIFLLTTACFVPSYAAVKGGIEYSIPVDYSKLSEQELVIKANDYYTKAIKLNDGKVSPDITNALNLYGVLQNLNPEKISYCVRQGVLYDKIGMDKYAKGDFSKAIGINSSDPEPYFYFGEFYYKRALYRKALKYYYESYERGYSTNYDLLYKLGDVYEKIGDTKSALKYLEMAQSVGTSSDLEDKINRVKTQDLTNREYYSRN
jgi:tetratricopeptide (TPR) repeat protein